MRPGTRDAHILKLNEGHTFMEFIYAINIQSLSNRKKFSDAGVKVAELLIRNGANVNAAANDGETVLQGAIGKRNFLSSSENFNLATYLILFIGINVIV